MVRMRRASVSDGAPARAIDRAELRRMLAKLRLLPPDAKAADAAVERMFASADANNDGGISFTEFLLLVRSSLVEQPPKR